MKDCIDHLQLPFEEVNDALLQYHRVFITRYANSINFVSHLPGHARILELAAAPYGMTAALRYHLFENLELASFENPKGAGFSSVENERRIKISVHGRKYDLKETIFNAESDIWPYPNDSFDAIICCEMIEHMAFDPMQVFAEANRTLRSGGLFFVSTPNACCIQNLLKIVARQQPGLAQNYRLPKKHGRHLQKAQSRIN